MRAARLIISVAMIAALLSLPQAWAAKPVEVEYCGRAISNGEWVDVVTRLATGPDGLLSGTYEFDDKGQMAPGTLRETKKDSEDTRILNWVDKYGTGRLVLNFSPDHISFQGLWGLDQDVPSLGWTGGICEANTVRDEEEPHSRFSQKWKMRSAAGLGC